MSLSDIQSKSRFGLHEAVFLCSQVDHHLLLLLYGISKRRHFRGPPEEGRGYRSSGSLPVSTAAMRAFTCGLFSQDSWDRAVIPPPPTPKVSAQPSLELWSLCITDMNSIWPLALLCHYVGAMAMPLTCMSCLCPMFLTGNTWELLKLPPPRTNHGEPVGWGRGECLRPSVSPPHHKVISTLQQLLPTGLERVLAYRPEWQMGHKLFSSGILPKLIISDLDLPRVLIQREPEHPPGPCRHSRLLLEPLY